MTMNLINFVCLLLFGSCMGQEVYLTQGAVQGTVSSDGVYFEFHGIPYAGPTSGSRRFQAPLPPPMFDELFIANETDVKCVRALGVGYEGTEDCLVANIFTPSLNSTSQLPVMVFIKGTEFDGPEQPALSFRYFVDQGIVVVTLNFRESIFGFLCLGTETAPGNAGLKDIIAGLRWVQENIAQFGGDPNDVTLIGHGTGAAAVDLITLSPLSEGLVHKAIAQSGSSLAPWAVTRNPTEYAIIVAEALGHTITDVYALSEIFTRVSVAALMGVINELELKNNAFAFAPCIENEHLEGDEKLILQSPYRTLISGEFAQIPFIIGFAENEGTIRSEKALRDDWLLEMDSLFENFIQSDLQFEISEEQENVAAAIKSYYFGDGQITMENIDDFISYHGDTMILISALREVSLRAAFSPQTYAYQFSYQGTLGEPFIGPLSLVGAGHGEDLGYLFNAVDSDLLNDSDVIMRNIVVDRWTNFVRTGAPSSNLNFTVAWLPVTTEAMNIIIFRNDDSDIEDTPTSVELALVDPYPSTLAFWNGIYAEYFQDAEGVWEPNGREDIEEVIVIESSGLSTEDPDAAIEPEETDSGTEAESEENSASKAIGLPLVLMSVFSVINLLHSNQIMF